MPLTVSVLSTEYVRVPVTPVDAAINPTSDVVSLAFIAGAGNPQSGDWKTGSWATGLSGRYYARALVGPSGDVSLAVGTYTVWVKFTDDPEIPARPTGQVIIR